MKEIIKETMKDIIHNDFFQGFVTGAIIITIFIEIILWKYGV